MAIRVSSACQVPAWLLILVDWRQSTARRHSSWSTTLSPGLAPGAAPLCCSQPVPTPEQSSHSARPAAPAGVPGQRGICKARLTARACARAVRRRRPSARRSSCFSWAASSSADARITASVSPDRSRRTCGRARGAGRRCLEGQCCLATGHGQIDVHQQLGIEQRAVVLAAGVVDAVALAQGIESVALAGMQPPRPAPGYRPPGNACATMSSSQPARRNSWFRKPTSNSALWMTSSAPPMNSSNSVRNLDEARLVLEHLAGNAVHLLGRAVDFALRVHVAVKGAVGPPTIHQLHASDLDDAMALLDFEAGRFGVEDDLSHASALTCVAHAPCPAVARPRRSSASSSPRLASSSARSFSG